MGCYYKTGTSKSCVVHKTSEATDELIGNKIAENIMKPKSVSVENSRNDKEINIPPEKR